MSYVALATLRFEEVCAFYAGALGLEVLESWDRPGGRGRVFDLHGLRVEILDAARERSLCPGESRDRLFLVAEVADVDAAHRALAMEAPPPQDTSWGTRLFVVRDPDGTPVTFLQKRRAAR